MEWYESKKPYIFFGIAIPAAVTVAVFLITEGILPRILTAILSFVCIPLIVLSLYMYAVGTGDKWINGINIAIVGKPNVGKSTLLNKILRQKVSIVSPKPQTTRNNITGILNDDDYQIVFFPFLQNSRARESIRFS